MVTNGSASSAQSLFPPEGSFWEEKSGQFGDVIVGILDNNLVGPLDCESPNLSNPNSFDLVSSPSSSLFSRYSFVFFFFPLHSFLLIQRSSFSLLLREIHREIEESAVRTPACLLLVRFH
ncbi:unnamed protein product [Arabidopsis halleri]